MPSLFRRLFSGPDVTADVGRALEEAAKQVAVAEEPIPEPVSESVQPALSSYPHTVTTSESGLIPADQLPSAAEALAELFAPEPTTDPFSTDHEAERGESLSADPVEVTATEQLDESKSREPVPTASIDTSSPPLGPLDAAERQAKDLANPQVTESALPDEPTRPAAEQAPSSPECPEDLGRPAEGRNDAAFVNESEVRRSAGETSGGTGTSEDATAPPERAAEDVEILKAAAHTDLESPASSGRDWKLEERLASHLEWLDSHGRSGLRADFSDVDLEGQELIGVKLRLADLHDANLRAADLLLADLRDANLMRADLEDSCLVGANLEAANLEGASLETAMGLVSRQLAGANLHDALLPPPIMEFAAAAKFARASRIAWRCFVPLIPLALLSWLIIWKVKDVQLLSDSALIPFLHSRTAATAMPTAQIFLLAPLVILSLYLVFHFHLQKIWDAALELPAIFPDGHPLDDRGPAIVVGLLRAHFWWIHREQSSTRWVEKAVSMLLAYWAVPFTLTLFWARYLTIQEVKGALLETVLVAVSVGVALHATMKTGPTQERWERERHWTSRLSQRFQGVSPLVLAGALGFTLLLVSIGTLAGVPHDRGRAPQYSPASMRRWASDLFWTVGFDPYADVTEAIFSRKPANWTGANTQVAAVKGRQLDGANFRYAQAYGIFLANSHLFQSDFEGAYLSEADLRGADLGHSNLRDAILDGALLTGANLNRAQLNGAMMARADLRWANLSYASLSHATLVDSRLDGATLYDARILCAILSRAELQKVDLRGAQLNAADLDHADLQQAYLWSAQLPGANLYGAQLQGALAIDADFRGADLREAEFAGTVLDDANLSGSDLDRADLRGALQLTASQVCSSRSRRGALLDDALAMQVTTECGGLQ